MALDYITDYVALARLLTQDQTQPFRYDDTSFLLAFNNAALESRRIRPDMWIGATLPTFYSAQTSSATASGNTLNFTSGQIDTRIVPSMLAYDVTAPLGIVPGITVNLVTASTIVLSAGVTSGVGVGSGDTIAFISATPAIDQQYRMAFVYYMCGQAQLRDEEETQDTRAAAFLQLFERALTGGKA